jgi:hypothetical protein
MAKVVYAGRRYAALRHEQTAELGKVVVRAKSYTGDGDLPTSSVSDFNMIVSSELAQHVVEKLRGRRDRDVP